MVSILRVGPRIPFAREQRRVRWNLPGGNDDNLENERTRDADEDEAGDDEEQQPTPTHTIQKLRICTLNIVHAGNFRLNAAIHCMEEMNVDVGFLTETKLTSDKHTKSQDGYVVTATKVAGRTGGVALVHRRAEGWGLESTRIFGENVIKTTLVCGRQRKILIGAYIPPSEEDGTTLGCIQQARDSVRNPNCPIILLGDFNVDLDNPAGNQAVGAERRLETAALVDSMGLQSTIKWFKQCEKRRWRCWTWRQRREGRLIGSVTDHILSTCRRSFINCQLKIPRFDTDHSMLMATIRLGSVKHHRRYVRSRKQYPLRAPSGDLRNEADVLLEDLLRAKEGDEKDDGRKASWISDATWKLVNRKASARKRGIEECFGL